MKVMIITCSPNVDGLTASCGNAAQNAAEASGAQTVMVNLNSLQIGRCQACGNGWGTCRNDHVCQVRDDFQATHALIADIDALVLVTPVYFGDMSESAKAFTDRLRRIEAFQKEKNWLENKPVLAVAAAGGSGNGVISCLTQMERFLTQVRAERFDFIGVTQKNKGYKLDTIFEATLEMISYLERKTK